METLNFSDTGLQSDYATRSYQKAPQTVRRALAFETSRFLKFANPTRDEAWDPYVRWAESLRHQPGLNSVVTFNYDRVPEMLGLFVPRPHQIGRISRGVPVYKMHGSTDWVVNRNDPDSPHVEQNEVAIENDLDLALAAPGGSKASLSQTLFEPVWTAAIEAISKADEVVIVGYSFPKTDALARYTILEALQMDGTELDDNGDKRVRQAHLVLGPDVDLPKNRRVLELIRPRMGPGRQVSIDKDVTAPNGIVINSHRLWAEDFIDDHLERTMEHL